MLGRTHSWIELCGVVALLGGLALVYVQIKQSTEITRIQLNTAIGQNWRAVDATRQSEEFAKVLAKSIEYPQELTLAEYLELDAYYLGVIDQLEAMASAFESGHRESTLDGTIANYAKTYFGNAFAKAWVNRHFGKLTTRNEAWVQMLLVEAEKVDSGTIEAKFQGILDDVGSSVDNVMLSKPTE